jgi:hypothetical protein
LCHFIDKRHLPWSLQALKFGADQPALSGDGSSAGTLSLKQESTEGVEVLTERFGSCLRHDSPPQLRDATATGAHPVASSGSVAGVAVGVLRTDVAGAVVGVAEMPL